MNERFLSQIEFLKWCEKLKSVERRSKVMNTDRRENSAEHSWHVMLLAIMLAEHSKEQIDLLRVLKMLAVHDLVEIECGDVFYYAKTQNDAEKELVAAKKLFSQLPSGQGQEFHALWLEFEENESVDAHFANAIDRFWPVVQNFHNEGGTWLEFQVKYEELLSKLEVIKKGCLPVWDYVEFLSKSAKEKGYIRT